MKLVIADVTHYLLVGAFLLPTAVVLGAAALSFSGSSEQRSMEPLAITQAQVAER